ncbi:fasciclin domain-containing protein [Haloferula sp. BvORR071]|uniref:fasciclin domain-containing protein n=1 Tax=Haloferula sp. BvORR071 TaxID=1396141 RepID=UPI00069798B4|nr:fasciclin domain-containing protein [Haloferula sp. BvORR071]
MKTNLTRIALLLALAPLTPVAIAQTTKEETTKKTIVTEVKVAPEPGTLAATINDSATFSILAKALKAADLEGMLGDPKGSFTVFAPTDDAFMKLKKGTLDRLLLPENKEKLRSLLLYHVLPGQFSSSELKNGKITTSNGEKVEIDIKAHTVQVEHAKVAKADLAVKNGIMHSVDEVIVPKSLDGFAKLDEK